MMLSLAQHPLAVSGGEWFNPILERIDTDAWRRKQTGEPCNLYKVFGHQRDKPGFDALLSSSFCVHLYREDKSAQLASWRKACRTGQWTCRHSPGAFPLPFPLQAEEWVEQGDAFVERCELAYSYECLISNWDACITEILLRARWPVMQLEKALEKQ